MTKMLFLMTYSVNIMTFVQNIYKKEYKIEYIMSICRCDVCNIEFKNGRNYESHLKTKLHEKRATNKVSEKHRCFCGKSYAYKQGLYQHKKTCEYIPPISEPSVVSQVDELKEVIAEERRKNTLERADLQAKLAQIMKAFEERTTVVSDDTTIELTHQESELSQLTMSTIEPPTTESESNELFPSPPKPTPQSQQKTLQSQPPSQPPQPPQPPQSLQYRTRGHPPIQPTGVYVNPFRNENMDYVTDNVTIKCIKRLYQAVPTLIRKIHFDSKHPENHNLRITNRKYPHVSAMTANQTWKFEDKYHVIDLLMNKAFSILEYTFQDNKDEFSPSQRTTFEEFIRKYNSQDKATIRTLRRNIDIILLNGC